MIHQPAIGTPQPHPILFVHGAWHGAWCWERYFMDIFARAEFDTYAFNLTGHEKPGRVKGINRIPFSRYVQDLEEAVAQLDRPPIIIAHSMGGMIVQKYLEKHSCHKAVLLAPVPKSGVLSVSLRFLFSRTSAMLQLLQLNLLGLVNSTEKAKWAFFSEDAPSEEIDFCVSHLCSESFLAFAKLLVPAVKINYHRSTPMLVLAAENDTLFSVNELKRTAQKYQADFQVVPNTAHDMMLDNRYPETVNAILNWLKST